MYFDIIGEIEYIEVIATGSSIKVKTMKKDSSKKFVICAKNYDYKASLEVRKIYLAIPDKKAASLHLIRIMDESGEDYLYPEDYFIPVNLPQTTEEALLRVV